MQQLPEQEKRRKEIQFVDVDLLGKKQNIKCFKSAAYAMGFGVGFLILSPLLPDIGDKEKSSAMADLYQSVSLCMIAYALTVTVGFFFFRKNIPFIMFVLNWFVVPTLCIWAVMEGYGIITQ